MDLEKLKKELDKPKKFGEWFKREFECIQKKSSLICNIDGKRMKVQNGVRNSLFNEEEKENMVKAVMKNHKINEKAGINYG